MPSMNPMTHYLHLSFAPTMVAMAAVALAFEMLKLALALKML